MTTRTGKKDINKSKTAPHRARKTGTKLGHMSSISNKGEFSGFCTLLREVQGGLKPVDTLFQDPIFSNRFRAIIRLHAQKREDAEELANDIRYKVWQSLPRFEPDYKHDYGNFFAWLRAITRNKFLDTLRHNDVEFSAERAEELSIADPMIDIEASFLQKELISELERCINTLPEKERLAVTYYVFEGLSSRATAERLTEAGFPSTHVAALRWIRDGLASFFPQSGRLLKPGKKMRFRSHPVTNVTASKAKNDFGSILQQAIHVGAIAITRQDVPKAVLIPYAEYELLERTRSNLLQALEADFENLLASMQTASSKRAVKTAFEASPAELGQAAVKRADKRRSLQIATLTTTLMTACAMNVVGRAINLSNDASLKASLNSRYRGSEWRREEQHSRRRDTRNRRNYYNPDEAARKIMEANPAVTQREANSLAWNKGVALLRKAIKEKLDFAFETTLGATTIPALLGQVTSEGIAIHVWYVGLSSPELHIARVRQRVRRGGHDIAEDDIRRRYKTSRLNLIELIPKLTRLRVFDNSFEANPEEGEAPKPVLVLDMDDRRIVGPPDLTNTPGWAEPIVAAAIKYIRS